MSRLSGPTDAVRCPRCGETFGCAAKSWGCWCGDVSLTTELTARLAAEYDGCLCANCLRELSPQP